MCKGTIIYVGNFELPDKGAAANRVAANGKLFRALGYQVAYLGVKKDADFEGVQALDAHETMYEEAYPRSNMEWLTHMYDTKNIEAVAARYDRVCMIILYNLPYILLKSVKRAFKGTGIKVVYDCTEWTGVTDGSFAKRAVKWLDEYLIRTRVAKAADGMIVISQMMKKTYAKNEHLILLPPLVDLHDAMWHQQREKETDIFEFCFAGILDGNKESLDSIVEAFSKLKETACMLRIIGVTEKEFCDFYPKAKPYLEAVRDRICFMGRLSHKETIKYVRNCDCYIFIRQSDRRNNAGFPTKFAESYSCGVPIITTDISDISCYLKGNERGQMLDSVSAKDVEKTMSLAMEHGAHKKEKALDMTFHYESYRDKSASWLKGFIK